MGNERLTRVPGSGLIALAVVAHQFWPFQTSLPEPALQLFSGVIPSAEQKDCSSWERDCCLHTIVYPCAIAALTQAARPRRQRKHHLKGIRISSFL